MPVKIDESAVKRGCFCSYKKIKLFHRWSDTAPSDTLNTKIII